MLMKQKKTALIPIPPPQVMSLSPIRDLENTSLSQWPRTIAMALHDFKATKKASSWMTYEVALRDFFQFLSMTGVSTPADLVLTHITSYIDYLRKEGKADRTIRLYFAAVSSFYDFLCRPVDTLGTSIIKSNPFRAAKDALPKVQAYEKVDERRELSIEEYHAILKTCNRKSVMGKRDYAMISLTFYTIRRRQEICRLKFQDFGVDKGVRFVRFLTKGGKILRIDLSEGIWGVIEDYWKCSGREMKPESPAWTGGVKKTVEKCISPYTLDQILKKRGALAGVNSTNVNVHVHGLRHLGARVLRSVGIDIKEIKERLGHARLDTTDIYLGSMERIDAKGLSGFEALALDAKKDAE